ncbi:MAG: DUF3185 domain-containing protein [Planctomycetes bacterium]|nr:DUF3185 domain-containing protein [Planctomycetota bacterium]
MSKQTLFVFGIILAVLGVAALGWRTIGVTTRETIVDVGPVKVMADRTRDVPILLIIGGVAVIGGVGLIVSGARKV